MDKIDKALQKLSVKERLWIKEVIVKLKAGDNITLDIRKLKGLNDIFRVRKGSLRVIYQLGADNKIIPLAINRRDNHTYDKF